MSAIRGICNTIFGPVKQAGKYVCNKSEFVNSVFTEVREPLMALKETRAQTIGVAKKMQAGTTTSSAKKVFNFISNQGKGMAKGMLAMLKKAGPVPGGCAILSCIGLGAIPGSTALGLTVGVVLKTLFKKILGA